jgi:hypothetical protein
VARGPPIAMRQRHHRRRAQHLGVLGGRLHGQRHEGLQLVELQRTQQRRAPPHLVLRVRGQGLGAAVAAHDGPLQLAARACIGVVHVEPLIRAGPRQQHLHRLAGRATRLGPRLDPCRTKSREVWRWGAHSV